LLLRAAGGIEGRVVDDKGEPWSNVGVSIRGTNTDCRSLVSADQAPSEVYQFNSRDVRTDARGCFRGTDVAAGSYELRAEIRGRDSTATVTVEVSDGVIRGDVEIVVPRGLAITGTLRYSDGRALGEEAAALHLSATNEKGEHVGTQLGPGGRFELLGLPAGPCTLTLARGPKGWSMSPQTGIAAGSKDVRLLLQPSSFLRGRVVDADGKPVKARVYASPDGSRSGSAQFTTDDDGRFEIEVPADFHGSVGAMHTQQQFLQAKIDDVSAGRSDLELQLRSPR
jgi:hypothetical protein